MESSSHIGVIDIGNTRLKVGVFSDDILLSHHEFPFSNQQKLIDFIIEAGITKIMVSNVSGNNIAELSQLPPNISVYYLGSETLLPFENNYLTPNTLGADRLALIAGAQHFYEGSDCLIIDAGTCVTYDVLTASGAYSGGNISPGLLMRLKAMHTFTGKLPLPAWSEPEQLMGTDTASCLLSGAWFGLIGEMNYFINHYKKNYKDLKVLLSGGDAAILSKHFKNSIFAHEHLLLYGLNKILIVNVR